MQRTVWTGLAGADPKLDALLDASDLADLVAAQDQRDAAFAALPNEDWWQRLGPGAGRYALPLALAGVGLAVAFFMPAGGRR